MVRRIVALGFAFTLVAGLIPACNCSDAPPSGGGGSSPTPTFTPGPGGEWAFTLDGTGFDESDGELVVVRIVHVSNILACDASTTVSGGTFSLTIPTVLNTDEDYSVEFFANLDGNATYNSGVDRTYRIELTGVTGDVAESYDAASGESGIAWPINTSCPTQ